MSPWANRSSVHFFEFLDALARHYGVDVFTPYRDLPEYFKQALFHGSGTDEIEFFFDRNNRRFSYRQPFEGIIPKLQRRYMETESNASREDIKRFMNFRPCPQCGGSRLNRAARSPRKRSTARMETVPSNCPRLQSVSQGW